MKKQLLTGEPLYKWTKQGIVMLRGKLKDINISILYQKDKRVLEYLEEIIDKGTFYERWTTKEVIEELLLQSKK